MDSNTQRELAKVSASIPQHLLRKLEKTVIDDTGEQAALEILKQPDLPRADRKRIEKLIEKGAFRKERKELDEDVAKKIDEHNTKGVQKLIREGKIPDPSTDSFVAGREQRIKNRQWAPFGGVIFRPTSDRVLAKLIPDPYAPKTKSVILIPEGSDEKKTTFYAKVIALGPGRISQKTGALIPMSVKVGDTILFSHGYEPIELDGDRAVLIEETNILGTLL